MHKLNFIGQNRPNDKIIAAISSKSVLKSLRIFKQELRNLYHTILAIATEILAVDSRVSQAYAEIFVNLRHKGKPIPTNDLWISAIARAHQAILVTNDDHFDHVEGITCEDWTLPLDASTNSSDERFLL